jgi:AcrR family transcriptional regulator
MTCRVIAYHRGVGRWKPGARERLISAAIELFSEQGFAATTVPQITERAGVTTRTFFRYFADKREVLFGHENAPAQARAILAQAPPAMSPAEFIAWGLRLMARERFDGHRDELRVIQALIYSDASLHERALRKREELNSLVGEALRSRGLGEQQSRLLAEAAVSALYIALDQWLTSDSGVSIDVLALEALAALRGDLDGIDAVQPPVRPRGRPASSY